MPNIGFSELIVILLILMLVFGASRLPALGEGLGKAIRSFKRGVVHDEKIEVTPTAAAPQSAPKRMPAEQRSSQSLDDVTDAEIVDESKS